jgi:hypothetical protein
VGDLEAADVITRVRDGRRNNYFIHGDRPLGAQIVERRTVRHLLAAILTPEQMRKIEQLQGQVASPTRDA